MKIEFSRHILEKFQISNFMKIPPVGAEVFRADRQADMRKLIVFFEIFLAHLKRVKLVLCILLSIFCLPVSDLNH